MVFKPWAFEILRLKKRSTSACKAGCGSFFVIIQQLRTVARHCGYLQVTLQSFRIRALQACAKEAANCLSRHKGSVPRPAMVIKKLILPVAGSFCRFRTGQEAPE
ncbi:hypothetical protein LZ24_00486 [Desulfobotulus alkaliphilus]|uniref:Uncharacterized protein n=1 Tax=Desulfobotulus alkaliphilus TaxID=622671 RepID=A0A562S815_9BACT|nr:hypothetical protein LZ24_00486 [Desulfobotulus alkaliphilus]